MMKKVLTLLALIAMIGVANAELLTNGDFEAGAGVGWNQWWGGNSGVGVPDPIEGDLCGGVWWSDDGIFQGIEIGADTYTVSGQISQENLFNRIGVIVAEVGVWNPDKWAPGVGGIDVWWTQQIEITPSDPTGTWLSGSTVIDNTTAGASYLNINLFLIDQGEEPAGLARFDNISVVPEPTTLALLGLGGLLLRRKRS